MNNIITINNDDKVQIGNINVKNKERLNMVADSILATLPKERIKRVQAIALSTLLKGLLNNPEPETKRQKFIYEALNNESLESIWNDCIKALNIKDEEEGYSMLHALNDLFEENTLEFQVIQEIEAKKQKVITSKNAIEVFNNSNAIGTYIPNSKKRRK